MARVVVREQGATDACRGTTREDWLKLLDAQHTEKEAQEEAEAKQRADFAEQQARKLGRISEFHSLDCSAAAVPEKYRGKDLKVIVKAANYILKPGQEYVGTWHMEGMDFNIDFTEEGDKGSNEEDEDKDEDTDDFEPEHDYPSDWEYTEYNGERQPCSTSELPIFTELGTVPATRGRIITFPNWIQHKVGGISHSVSDPAAPPATRRILCFFLVDENQTDPDDNDTAFYHSYTTSGFAEMNVLSSSDVPWQAQPCNIATLHLLLSIAWKRLVGKEIPAELRSYIVTAAIEGTITREEAERWRRELMIDRKIKATDFRETRFWDGSYSLCEH
ncbi:hypothetical protein PLEOSDRAFT_1081730 [Pleurotus ostreatus PC15]|uniref:DUF4246 domain-containing protein n=1 Tax=Pleurotus ostreatus (strain PC15) TaxID=1137138 RepID=A0A067P2P4_PLEO1|nr:hypothetical protein PLEOSDRAFT_1081730 [Pleurotus ostreatus PC15]